MHRDLKPDNIVLNLDPLEVRIIDFDAVFLDSTTTVGTARGTPGYFPFANKWRDRSKKWDIWAMAAIILECDMFKDGYFNTKGEDDTKQKLKMHLKRPSTHIKINELMYHKIMRSKEKEMIDVEEMKDFVLKIKF